MNVTERHDQGSFMQLDKLSIKITDQKQSKVKPACRFQPRNISSWPIWSVTPPEATRFYLLVPPNTQWCVFFCSLYYRVSTCYHQILASLSRLPKLALVLLLLLKLGQHCQTTHTGSSDQFVFLLSLLLFFFLGPQVTHIGITFSGKQSLALDQLKGHLERFAKKCTMDQKVPAGRLPTPLHTLALKKRCYKH